MRILILIYLFSALYSSDLIIKYINLKDYYFNNQIINLKLKIISPKEENLSFIAPFAIDINTTKLNKFTYLINLIYKIDDLNKIMFIKSEDKIIKTINVKKYKVKYLENIPYFSNIIATDLKVTNILATRGVDNSILLNFTLNSSLANLDDFNLDFVQDLRIDRISKDSLNIFLKINSNNFYFYYFDPIKETFNKINIPISLKEEVISTQEDINPEVGNFFTPLNIFILFLIAFFLIIFLVYQKIFLLIFPIILSLLLLYEFIPKGNILVKRGAKLYILPTYNARPFYEVKTSKKAFVLSRRGNYLKIKIDNKIGWVRSDYVKKDD